MIEPSYEYSITRCQICKDTVDYSYQQYLELLKFLREEIFLMRPHFYNRQAHGKSVKWYWYSVPSGVFTESETTHSYLFIMRLEKLLKSKFPDFCDKISVVVNNQFSYKRSVIVRFKYHNRYEEFFENE